MNKYQKASLIIGLICASILVIGAITVHWFIAMFLIPPTIISIAVIIKKKKRNKNENRA